MNVPKGKGMFMWQLKATSGGVIVAAIAKLKAGRFGWAQMKVCDGIQPYGDDGQNEIFAHNCLLNNITVWGWGYSYGVDPAGEGRIAAERVNRYGLAGYLLDVEMEWEKPGMEIGAQKICETYLNICNKPLYLCSFRFPNLHPLPWRVFEQHVYGYVPQVYWQGAHNPANQLGQSILQYRSFTEKPIIPAGSAYSQSGWSPTVADFREFNNQARVLGLSAVTWWVMQTTERNVEWWNEISTHEWGNEPAAGDPAFIYKVTSYALNVRSDPFEREGNIVGTLKEGDVINAEARSGDWLKIFGSGWVHSAYVTPLSQQPPDSGAGLYRVDTDGQHLYARSGPGKGYSWVYMLDDGQTVTVRSVGAGGWCQLLDGHWVSEEYLVRITDGTQPSTPPSSELPLEGRVQKLEDQAIAHGWEL